MNSDRIAKNFACNIWFALLVGQGVLCILRVTNEIQWHWLVVLIPLWVFLLLPIVSALWLMIFAEEEE